MPSTSKENEPSQRRVLNLKAFAILIGSGTLLWIGTHCLHGAQVGRTSEYLKRTAEQALADADHHRAFDLFEQYLVLNPHDDEAEEQISQLLEDHGNSAKALQRAFQINEKFLRADRSRDDLRLRQIRIADRLGRYSDAAVHLKTMRENRSDLADVWHFSGIVAQDTGDFTHAIEYFQTAVQLQDPVPESFEFLAQLLTTESSDPEAAERLLGQLIENHDSPKSRRIRATWYLGQDRPLEAIPDLWAAVQADPVDLRTNAMLLKAVRLAKTSDRSFDADQQYRQLIGHLTRMVSEHPDETKMRLYLSSVLWAVGERDAAIENLDQGIQRDPRRFEMHEVLVDYLVSDRRYERAQKIFEQIPVRAVDRGRREFMRGRLLMSQKQWPEAIHAFEMALGFAQQDPSMASRARVCLALCRRESGDHLAAMDSYRALIQSDPNSEGGRLGMASAYLRADQTDLAIAEYRQLLHVDGVPAFLVNLMIRHNLTLPKQSRDWSEVESILKNQNSQVSDPMQRTLLQADLLFAKGFPAQAMELLDEVGQSMPERPEIQRAFQRLSSVHGDRLLQRVKNVLDDDPANMEAHTTILRLLSTQEDAAGLTNWLNGLLSGRTFPQLNQGVRLSLLARTASLVGESEELAHGSNPQSQLILTYAQEAWRRMALTTPQHVHDYIRFLAIHRSADDALNATSEAQQLLPEVAAVCWLECLRQSPDDAGVRGRVDSELGKLIQKHPSNVDLLLAYSDAQILTEQYSPAETLLKQLADFDKTNGRALGRLAWLAALIQRDHVRALQLSAEASLLSPSDPNVRSIRGLTLAEANQTAAGLDVLTSIPSDERSMASYVFEAQALQLANRSSEAAELVRRLGYRRVRGNLVPAEQRMLQALQQQLQVTPPQLTSR